MHIHDIMQKLGVRNRTQAALLAIKLPKPEGDQG
jgi:DNA-binding NarL/FixJ family response regulator